MIKIGIVGISGYSGLETLKLLLKHPHACLSYVSADSTQGKVSEIWPQLSGSCDLMCKPFDSKKAIASCDLIFLAVPHTVSMAITPKLLTAGLRVIDLSGDYRLKTASQYQRWYGTKHQDIKNLSKAVYGLPELYRENIKSAQLVSNPGCYPTAALLALAPLAMTHHSLIDSITIDAKSGVTGAGRKPKLQISFSEVNENFNAYKPLEHQHVPEMELHLSKIADQHLTIDFVPHLLPLNRGILETIYIRLNDQLSLSHIHKIYTRFYKTEPFVRILSLNQQPELKNVVFSNYCDIALTINHNSRLLVITSVIDNLVKGAAGQAIQNMNIMYGFNEKEGLL